MSYIISARSSSRDVWIESDFPAGVPLIQADGSNIFERVVAGETDTLGFVPRFKVANRGTRWGDLLWTTGDTMVASRRLVDLLAEVTASSWRPFEVEIIARGGGAVHGYHGLAVTGTSEAEDLYHAHGGPWFCVYVSDRLVAALQEAGVTALEMEAT